jgi:flagellar hook-associated protein 3 FlgL
MVPLPTGNTGNDITITPEGGIPITISGDPGLTDTNNNYAGKVAALFSQAGTGLVGTANAATIDLGSAPLLTGFDNAVDDYTLNITSNGSTVSVQPNVPAGTFDNSLAGMISALETIATTVTVPGESGTLSNGVSYDISSGSLVLTGPSDGSEIELDEVLTDAVITPPGLSGVLTSAPQTVYGTINIATNSTTNVDIAGATATSTGLASVGLTAGTLDGASKMDLFTVLTRVEEAIRAGNVNDINGAGGSIQSQLKNLDIAAEQNRSLRSQLGARASRVDTAMLHQEDAKIDLKQILSRYQDADIIEVYNDIMQKESAFKAALNITSRVSQISILDYF